MRFSIGILIAISVLALSTRAHNPNQSAAISDSQIRPPVAKADVEIVRRARQILNSVAKWNREDNRICPADAKKFSLYCALEKATDEVSGNFEHRSAAMQEARFVIDDVLAKGNKYEHRLMNYNNDPKTTFADVQKFFNLLEERIQKRLDEQNRQGKRPDSILLVRRSIYNENEDEPRRLQFEDHS